MLHDVTVALLRKSYSLRSFSSPVRGAKKKASRKTCFFLSNPKDWYGITRRVYGIRRKATVWHHASACILLRIDYIQHFVLIPYRRQAADFIHAYRRDYIESYVEVFDFQGLFVFLGVKNTPFHHCTFSCIFWSWTCDFMRTLEIMMILWYNLQYRIWEEA